MNLCHWCEAVVDDESQELCHKCLDAQRRVASGNLIQASPEKKNQQLPQTIGRRVLKALILAGKGLVLFVLGWAIIILGLLGTCMTIAAASTASVPLTALGYLFAAIVAFAALFAVIKLTNMMLLKYSPKAIERKPKQPPQIERND